MKKGLFIACVGTTLLLAGCATTEDQSAQKDTRDDVYVTGSRLPAKTGGTGSTSAMSRESWEDSTRGLKQVNPQGR